MPSRICICSHCGRERFHGGHGWCRTCYSRWWHHGKPKGGPATIVKKDRRTWVNLDGLKRAAEERSEYHRSLREEYFEFREDFGMSMNDAADRIGIVIGTARRWEKEAKKNNGKQSSHQ